MRAIYAPPGCGWTGPWVQSMVSTWWWPSWELSVESVLAPRPPDTAAWPAGALSRSADALPRPRSPADGHITHISDHGQSRCPAQKIWIFMCRLQLRCNCILSLTIYFSVPSLYIAFLSRCQRLNKERPYGLYSPFLSILSCKSNKWFIKSKGAMLVYHTTPVRVVLCCKDIAVIETKPAFFWWCTGIFGQRWNVIRRHALIWHLMLSSLLLSPWGCFSSSKSMLWSFYTTALWQH